MIIQIDLAGKTVIEKFKSLSAVNNHWDKEIHPNIVKLMKRDSKITHAHGFLWANLPGYEPVSNEITEKMALEQVQDLVLQNLMSNVNVFEKQWNIDKIKRLIEELKY